MRIGTGGIFAIAVSGVILVGLTFALVVGGFMRELSGEDQRWSAQTANGRGDLTSQTGNLGLDSNVANQAGLNLPPNGDADGDGVLNGVDPDPTNPDNPKPNPNAFHIDSVQKLVFDAKSGKLQKTTSVAVDQGGTFVINLSLTNDKKSHTIRLADTAEKSAGLILKIANLDPNPDICYNQPTLQFLNNVFCQDKLTVVPSNKITIKEVDPITGLPVWDIIIPPIAGEYAFSFYVSGTVKTAGSQVDTATACEPAVSGSCDNPVRDNAAITGIERLDMQITKLVQNGTTQGWSDIVTANVGQDVHFRIRLALNNAGGDHTVNLEDSLSGLIFKSGTVTIGDGPAKPFNQRDLAGWSYTIHRDELGGQAILFDIIATPATPGILTNTATAFESDQKNSVSSRAFVIATAIPGNSATACVFCKLGRVQNSATGWSNFVLAHTKDTVEFQIVAQVNSNQPVTVRDLLPDNNALTYLPGSLTLTENGDTKPTPNEATVFGNDGLALTVSHGSSATFILKFSAQVQAGPDFKFANTAIKHITGTPVSQDLSSQTIIASKHDPTL